MGRVKCPACKHKVYLGYCYERTGDPNKSRFRATCKRCGCVGPVADSMEDAVKLFFDGPRLSAEEYARMLDNMRPTLQVGTYKMTAQRLDLDTFAIWMEDIAKDFRKIAEEGRFGKVRTAQFVLKEHPDGGIFGKGNRYSYGIKCEVENLEYGKGEDDA